MNIAKRHLALFAGIPFAAGVLVFAALGSRQLLPSPPASSTTLSAQPLYIVSPQSASVNSRALLLGQEGSTAEVIAPTTSFHPAEKGVTHSPTPEEQQKMLSALQEAIQKNLNEDRQLQDLLRASIQRRLEEDKTK